MDPLRKTYRREQIAEALRGGIRGGEWTGWLPSERELSRHFNVGRDQVHQAIAGLREEGWLQVQGRRNRILRRPRPRVRARSVTILTPARLEAADRILLYLVDQLRAGLEPEGVRLHIESSPEVSRPRPGRRLERLRERRPGTLWLLHQAPAKVQDWFHARGESGLILGTGASTEGFPYLDIDQAAAARHASGRLLAAGHGPDEVLFVRPEAELAGFQSMAEGIREVLGRPPVELRAPASLPTLARRLARRRWAGPSGPRAILCAGVREALFLHGWIPAQTGATLGNELSLCCLGEHRHFGDLWPALDHYTMRSRAYARRLLRLTRHLLDARDHAVPGRNLVVPAYVPGASVRPRIPR